MSILTENLATMMTSWSLNSEFFYEIEIFHFSVDLVTMAGSLKHGVKLLWYTKIVIMKKHSINLKFV